MKYVLVMCLALVGCGKTSPTVSLSANPSAVEHGQCATLTWSSENAATVSIDPEVGNVDPSGSKEVCPLASTVYTITAAGEGASGTASATIDVTPMTSTAMIFPEAALFEFGKSDLKPEGKQKIEEYRERAKDELTRADQVMVTGYTDNVGTSAHNAALSLQRAEAVRDHLVSLGADPQKYEVKGAGDSMPIADNSTDEGRAKNRRVEVAVIGAEK
jgi:outer membrane protein OmpA-like peptidoglycan-associated protein